jgi:hypothetical protein
MNVPIAKLKANPTNPRVLRDEKFAKLKQSLVDFPDMLNKRPIVAVTDTDGKLMVLGGNMRLRACMDLKMKEVPVILADEWTEEQRREFIIKDNVGFGEHGTGMRWRTNGTRGSWMHGGWMFPLVRTSATRTKRSTRTALQTKATIKLTYSLEDYEKVREALSKVAATPEQAVWKAP